MSHGVHLGVAGAARAFVPTDIAGCILWLRADMGITLAGADVSAWADQSGTAHHVVTGGNRPEYVAAGGVGGKPGVDFVRANSEYMQWAAGTWTETSTSYTLFTALVQRSATSTLQTLMSWQAPPSVGISIVAASQPTPGPGAYNAVDGWLEAGACTAAGQILTHHIDDVANLLTISRDGVALGTAAWLASLALADAPSGTPVKLGSYFSAPNHRLDAVISEMIIYNTALAAGNLALVHAYLKARYGL